MESKEQALNEIREAREALEANQGSHEDIAEVAEEAVAVMAEVAEDKPVSEAEEKALAAGWKPQEDIADGVDFVSAEEFIRRGELFDKISTQGKEIRELRTALKGVSEGMKASERRAYDQAINDLSVSKRAAVEEGDVDTYSQLELREKELQKQILETAPVAGPDPQAAATAALEDFRSRNTWFTTNLASEDQDSVVMSAYAVARDEFYRQYKPDLSPEDALLEIEKDVKARFKSKFKNERRDAPSSVEGAGKKPASKGKGPGVVDLSDRQKEFCTAFVKAGLGNEQDYIKRLINDGVL